MPSNSSPRQTVLQKLWNSTGQDDVWNLMARESAARAADISPELLREADDCRQVNPNLAERLEAIGEEVARVNTSVDRFAAITGMADLLELNKSYEFSWLGKFNRILGGYWADALRSGDQQRIQGLRNGMKVLQSVYIAIHEAQKPEGKGRETWTRTLQSNPLLCDPHLHEFLDRRAHFAAKHNHPSAEGFAQLADYLRLCCKTVQAITKLEEHRAGTDGGDGFVEFRLPLKPEQAELWFAISKNFIATASDLAKKVNEGTVPIQNAITTIIQFPEGKKFARQDKEDKKSRATFFSSAFLEHLLLVASPGTRLDALNLYRDLVATGHWSSQESRATFVLRYAKAVLVHWRYFPDPSIRLHEAIDLIDETLPFVDVTKSPRLTRDLWFVHARILENIGIWEPEVYEAAAVSYQRGLDVPNIAFELEARGMALTDYANTLSRLHPADEEAHDKKITATFREALTILKTEKRILGGTLALNSYAIYLNERRFGERVENQERALALAQEAIDLIEGDRENFDESNDYLRRTIAGPYLTKSNVILQREVGDDYSAHKAGIDALHSAWDKLGKSQDDQLRGIIKLNLGHAYIALYAMTGDTSGARDAMYAYHEAEGLLHAYPLEYSQAILGTAMLVSEVPECCSPEGIQESLVSGEKALALLEKTNVPTALARAWACLAELRLLRKNVGDDEAAIEYLSLARDKFFAAGSIENAITAAQRIAAVQMQIFYKTTSLDAVRAAKDVLLTATKWVDKLWEQIDSVGWHYLISDRYSDVYADIAWCQSVLGDPLEEMVFMAARAKGREFLAHSRELQFGAEASEKLGEYADQLRVDSRLAESKRWQASRKAKPDIALDEVMRDSREEMRRAELRRRLLFPRPAEAESVSALAAVEAFLLTHPKSIILDITLSRWGTVALLFGGKDASGIEDHQVITLPLKVSDMMRPVWDWLSNYRKYLGSKGPDREDARAAWADATDRLLELVGPDVMQPCLASLSDSALDFSLIVAAGRLAGLPLHAARLADGRFVAESVGTVEYIPNLSVLSPKQEKWEHPKTALCVVSDPGADLASAAPECDAVAKTLMQSGTKVSVLAIVGRDSGGSAFKRRGVVVAPETEILGELPTPARVADLMSDKEHFFYSGHGTRAGGQSALVLVGEDGNEKLFSEDEILSMPALRHRPLIVLSACETARGEQGSSELFDVASCFLRIGARYVIGSLWVVVGDCATAFTASFYEALKKKAFPNEAFGLAVRELRSHRATRTTASKVPLDHPIYWAPFLALRGE